MEDEELLLLLMICACTTKIIHLIDVLPKSRRRRIWVKDWLLRRSRKSVYYNIVSELRLTDRYEYRKYLRMNTETFEVNFP